MSKLFRFQAVCMLALFAGLSVQAAQYWWDSDGAGANLGGSGNWDTGSSLWRTPTSTDALTTWNNDGAQEAVFTNAAGTVTLGATKINVNTMRFIGNTANWTFNSGTLDFGNGGLVVITNNDFVTLNSSITGTGTLTLNFREAALNSGYARGIALYGNNSAFTGKMSFQKTAGTYFYVWATNDFNFGAVPAVYTADALTSDGMTLQQGGTILTISANRGITVGGNGLNVNATVGGTINLNSVIASSGSGTVILNASTGTINLNAVNTYSGNLRVDRGGIVIGVDNALAHGAGKGNVTLNAWNSSTAIDLNGHLVTINGLNDASGATYASTSGFDNSAVGTATLVLGDNNANGNIFAGMIKNTGGALSLTKIGTGTQTLSGTNTYTGATTVNAGTLQVDLSVKTNDVISPASSLTLGGGTLNIKGKSSGTSSQTLGNPTVNPADSTISITPNGGSGTTLTLGNTWTRQVGGTLLVDLSTAGSTVSSSPTLQNGILGYAFVKDATGTGFATVSGVNVVRYTGETVLDAAVAGGTLNGTVNYVVTNGVTLSGGTGTSTQTVNSLFIGVVANPVIAQNGRILVVGAGGIITTNASWTRISSTGDKMTSGTGDLVFNIIGAGPDVGSIVDNGATKVGVTKTGSGSLAITSGNTYSGDTVINQGALNGGASIPNGPGKGNLLVNAGASYEMAGLSGGINGLSQSTNNTGGTVKNTYFSTQVTLTVGNGDASASFAGVIAGTSPGIALVKVGSGTQTLSGVNTYAGGTTLSNGVLSVSSDSNLGAAGGNLIFAGGTLMITGTTLTNLSSRSVNWSTFNGGLNISDAANTFTVTNAIRGSGALTKSGSGTLVLSAMNSYGGGTTISNGTLKLACDNALPSTNCIMPADLLTPIDVSALQTGFTGRHMTNSINGSGMSPNNPVVSASTADNNANNMWLDNGHVQTWITFDLGSSKTIGGIRLWNYNEATSGLMTRGIKDTSVCTGSSLPANGAAYNTMGTNWGTLVTNMTFAEADGSATMAGRDYMFPAPVSSRYIQLYVITNWGATSYTGLSEIRFLQPDVWTTVVSTVTIASGAVLDLAGYNQTIANLAGSGTITNLASGKTLTITGTNTFSGTISGGGTQVVSGVISPAGPGTVGQLTLANNLALTGTLEVDVTTGGTSDLLVTQGALDLTGAKMSVVNTNGLSIDKQYVVLAYSNAPTGSFSDSSLPPHWTTKNDTANKRILLRRINSGFILTLQ